MEIGIKRGKTKSDTKLKKILFYFLIIFFIGFLLFPIINVIVQAFNIDGSFSVENFLEIISSKEILRAFANSFGISILSSLITTAVALIAAIGINFTNINKYIKKFISIVFVFPMFLPTITYGFAIMYSFGKQGYITRLFSKPLFDIYGVGGLVLGFFLYTIPVSFILLNNGMKYVDKKYSLVSTLLYDNGFSNFIISIIKPLRFTIIISIIQCFFLSFTDFGVPVSLSGRTLLISKSLYDQMMGTIPDFSKGAVIAIMMMLPSILCVIVINIFKDKESNDNMSEFVYIRENKIRDFIISLISIITSLTILSILVVVIIIPFFKDYPYDLGFTLDNIKHAVTDNELFGSYRNSILVALIASCFGTIISYLAALFTARRNNINKHSNLINIIASVVNTIPGMVLGIAYLLAFSGTSLQNTLTIIIICNMIHYFSTPYLMFCDSLGKLNQNWEVTSRLLLDSWHKNIFRILIPNSIKSIIDVFTYYFINNMVTVSAVIFLAGARTMVITTKIKELQYFMKFDDIFVISAMILITNIIVKAISNKITNKKGVYNEIY